MNELLDKDLLHFTACLHAAEEGKDAPTQADFQWAESQIRCAECRNWFQIWVSPNDEVI